MDTTSRTDVAGFLERYAEGLVGGRSDLGAVEPLPPNFTLVDGGAFGIQVVVDTTARR